MSGIFYKTIVKMKKNKKLFLIINYYLQSDIKWLHSLPFFCYTKQTKREA